MIARIRSVFFNILFYGVLTPVICILTLPSLLFPRKVAVWVAEFYQTSSYYLEKYVMGIDYEVRGLENLPQGGEYLVAAKHQSAHETMKLHMLFPDPTIILKKELLRLPLFGWFLKRVGVIPIDRTNRGQAMTSIVEGAIRMKAAKRPIIIFPQGTRVAVDETTAKKPYKGGVAKMYGATGMPIVPLALNSGLYWPRNSFWKRPGKAIFEFLPPIPPGLPEKEVMHLLEEQIETASARLVEEARAKDPSLRPSAHPPAGST